MIIKVMEGDVDNFDITEQVIGCAYRVHNKMGSGFLENVYEKCLEIEFKKYGIAAEFQKKIDVFYDQQSVGSYFADILVDNRVVVELKAVRKLSIIHEVQLVNYLTATNIAVGLLINFGENKVEVKRRVLKL